MSAERGFTPLPEANSNRVRTTLKLPYNLENSIGLHLKSTESLCQLGGVASILIRNGNHRTAPVILGVTGDGTALGGFTSAGLLTEVKNNKDPGSLPPSCRWSRLEIMVNESESIARLEGQGKDLKEPAHWAKIIDGSIKDGVSVAATENLLKRPSGLLLLDLVPVVLLTSDILGKNYSGATFLYSTWYLINKISHLEHGFERAGGGQRWSLSILDSPEIDRLLALHLIMPLPRLSKKIK